jgi:hypothetical protein
MPTLGDGAVGAAVRPTNNSNTSETNCGLAVFSIYQASDAVEVSVCILLGRRQMHFESAKSESKIPYRTGKHKG